MKACLALLIFMLVTQSVSASTLTPTQTQEAWKLVFFCIVATSAVTVLLLEYLDFLLPRIGEEP